MSKILRIGIVFILLFSTFTFTGCKEEDGSDYIFKYDIDGNPGTLDPQSANDKNAFILIDNIFLGLLTLNEQGEVISGVAKSYTVSDDGLVYRFVLRDDVYWNDGRDFKALCTAKDFVFAFQRLFNPATKSKTASTFFCIKNAKLVNSGAISDLSKIGVVAEDDFTLTITLESPNPFFPVLLTTAPAMPCNEEFFISTQGKYGLNADCVASNGAFYLKSWTYDKWSKNTNNLILRRNKENNTRNHPIYPYGLNFFIDEESPLNNFYNEESHCIIASGEQAVLLLDEDYSYTESTNTVWGLVFNNLNEELSNPNVRLALAHSIKDMENRIQAHGYSPANGFIPSSISIVDKEYRAFAGSNITLKYDPKSAKNFFDKAKDEIGTNELSQLRLIVPNNAVIKEYLSYILQDWQSELGLFITTLVLSDSEFKKAVDSNNYDIAFIQFRGEYNSPLSYLEYFSSSNSKNTFGYSDMRFDILIQDAEQAISIQKSAENYRKAEKHVLEQAWFIPICFQTEYFFMNRDCKDILHNPFTGSVIFQYAKYFG